MKIGVFSFLLLSFAIFDSIMNAKNRAKLNKLHDELKELEKNSGEFDVSDIPIYAAIRQIEMRVRNLKCADLCRVCRKINQLNTEQTNQ